MGTMLTGAVLPTTNFHSSVIQSASDKCGSWRVVPAITLIAVCIIGIITALFWSQPYLTIPFALGLLASFYQLYISGNYKHLMSLGESAKGISENHQKLSTEVKTFSSENATLKANVSTLNTNISHLTTTKNQLMSDVERLNNAIKNMNEILETYKGQAESSQKTQTAIKISLESLQNKAQASVDALIEAFESVKKELGLDHKGETNMIGLLVDVLKEMRSGNQFKNLNELLASTKHVNELLKAATDELNKIKNECLTLKSEKEGLNGQIQVLKGHLTSLGHSAIRFEDLHKLYEKTIDLVLNNLATKGIKVENVDSKQIIQVLEKNASPLQQ